MNESSVTLSNRELDVLYLIADEYTTNEIATRLFISKHTVLSHRKKIQQKLEVKNTAGIVRRAFELRFIKLKEISQY